ncbi:phosphotransferase [Devosia sp. A8/3-2]|nr:phosphotransferase [Devosia sp. A8/3-2]
MPLGRLIGSGKEAEVFEAGPDVLKLYRVGVGRETVDREAGILNVPAPLPLPVPRLRGVVEIDGRWGILMSRAEGPPLSASLRPHDLESIADGVAQLHQLVHAQPGGSLNSYKMRLARDIGRAMGLDEAERGRLLQHLAELPDGDRLCHGDFHPANIMGSLDRPIIVDWPDARAGRPRRMPAELISCCCIICRTWLNLISMPMRIAQALHGPCCSIGCRCWPPHDCPRMCRLRRTGCWRWRVVREPADTFCQRYDYSSWVQRTGGWQ